MRYKEKFAEGFWKVFPSLKRKYRKRLSLFLWMLLGIDKESRTAAATSELDAGTGGKQS